jgi:hypothetical protein
LHRTLLSHRYNLKLHLETALRPSHIVSATSHPVCFSHYGDSSRQLQPAIPARIRKYYIPIASPASNTWLELQHKELQALNAPAAYSIAMEQPISYGSNGFNLKAMGKPNGISKVGSAQQESR